MMALRLAASALALSLSAAALSACSPTGNAQIDPLRAAGNRLQSSGVVRDFVAVPVRRAPHPLAGRSWFDPAAKDGQLLYISDYNLGVVYTYSFPAGKMVGALYGMGLPRGMCVGSGRTFWITNAAGSQITKYQHGGVKPIATLHDPGNDPIGCSYDTRTGDLAVANINRTDGGPGSITIFRYASGRGRNYKIPNFFNVDFLDFDKKGNLYFDGQDENGAFLLAKFLNGQVTPITVTGATINFPGGVQFENNTLTVGDQDTGVGYSIVYRMTTAGTVTGQTNLMASADCVQYFLTPYSLVCPNAGGPNAQIYHWPKGGNPAKTLSGSYDLPIGSVVSK